MSFKPEQLYLIFDYETYSEVDLLKVGSYVYANHKSTEILCASFRLGTLKSLPTAKVRSFAPKKEWNAERGHNASPLTYVIRREYFFRRTQDSKEYEYF